MNFFKKITYIIFALFFAFAVNADNHDKEQNIVERAKEVNQKIKEQQANKKSNISSEINNEEPLPLNDPFVGDSSLSGGNTMSLGDPQEAQNEMSLYKFKLVGVMSAEQNQGFVTLINAAGDVITIRMFEELSPGVKLVAVNNKEAVFEKNSESLLVINFKNQISERSF